MMKCVLGGYRLSIIAKIPWLRELDFVTITKVICVKSDEFCMNNDGFCI